VSELARPTPLRDRHAELGARFVPFAGWEMPVQYAGVTAEHRTVREAAGLFDVSHMGELFFEGPDAGRILHGLVTNDIHGLETGRALYTVACNEGGTILDDLIVYRLAEERYLVVCNASNRDKMATHFGERVEAAGAECSFADRSDDHALIALQGPRAELVLRGAGANDVLAGLPRFGVAHGTFAAVDVIVARTGYTGEDGFELFCAPDDAVRLWDVLLSAGETHGTAPIGLGARDTLRLEACLMLYGNDIDETTNPYEAGLGWTVKLKAGDFLGRDALAKIKADKPARKLVGFEVLGRGIARSGYRIMDAEGEPVGNVTSGAPGLTVGKNIGLGYVPRALAKAGTHLGIEIRGKVIEAAVVPTPFYKREH
jgi:aminomethyltransferase